ncbi:Hsp70 family protein [Haloglomus halophilum]|uniref:Hsp70 family protein n=1 Tax=Haloglomus halophilum TaxID=2962672 RepID=UPI0020C958EC|nr:Hsp70 family protein [Haloglomus halophilum]
MRIGIDLGTTTCAMAYFDIETEETRLIRNDRGEEFTPPVVYIDSRGADGARPVVGEAALANRPLNPERVLTHTRQDIDGEEVTYQVGDEEYTPVQAATYILAHLKEQAERSLDEDVEGAVITVPHDFATPGRKRTEKAAEAAGFEVDEIIDEPTAACLSYIYQNDIDGTLLVYDLGGKRFDATLVEVGTLVDVVATESDHELGGEDFDDALYDYVSQKIVDKGGPDPANAHEQDRAALQEEVTDAKHALSYLERELFVWEGVEVEVTREELESVLNEHIQRTIDRTAALFETDAVRDEGITRDDVDHVLLVGGSTRLPPVQERVEAFFGQEPRFDIDPDTVVARGAALQAAEYRDDFHSDRPGHGDADLLAYNIGIESHAGTFIEILETGARLPAEVTETYTNPADNATELRIPLWAEGEDGEPVDEAGRVGDIVLEGLPKRPAGELHLEVTLTVQHDGSLHVEAVETGTGTTVEATLDIDGDDPWPDIENEVPDPDIEAFDHSRPGSRDEDASDG